VGDVRPKKKQNDSNESNHDPNVTSSNSDHSINNIKLENFISCISMYCISVIVVDI
jgi:hypothetical protein